MLSKNLVFRCWTLEEFEKGVLEMKGKCCSCGTLLQKDSIRCYPHDQGRFVHDKEGRQWIYFECPCGIQSALWKVDRQILFSKVEDL